MDTNTNNQQINVFNKGMNTDISDAYIGNDQYRLAKNLRFVTDTGENSGELRTIEGYKEKQFYILVELEVINQAIEDILDNDHTITREDVQVSISDGIATTRPIIWDDETEYMGNVQLAIVPEVNYNDFDDPITPIDWTDWPYTETEQSSDPEELTEEGSTIIITYTGNADPVTITLRQPCEFEEILACTTIRNIGIIVGSLSGETGWSVFWFNNSESDLVLRRVFGPCTEELGEYLSIVARWESDNNKKIYIADGLHNIMSIMFPGFSGTSINDIAEYNSIALGQITCAESLAEGTLTGPVIQYAYRLYQLGSGATNTAPMSKPIVLYDNTKGYSGVNKINKAVGITIPATSAVNLNRALIFRIEYVQNGQAPLINVIYDSDYDGSTSFTYTDTGYNISEISVADFIATTGLQIKPVLIESKNDYLFAANLRYDLDEVDDLFKDVDTTDRSVVNYEIINGSTVSSYNRLSYTLNNDNSLVDGNYGRSLMHGETYRYGIVFYDKKGRRSTVKYIDDIEIPELEDCPSDITILATNNEPTYHITRVGLKFTINLDSYPTAKENCSGYEIVRCNRTIADSKTITQGIINVEFSTQRPGLLDTNIRFSNPFMTINKMRATSLYAVRTVMDGNIPTTQYDYTERDSGKYISTIASPEIVYLLDDMENVIKIYNNLSILRLISYSPYIHNIQLESGGYSFIIGSGNCGSYIGYLDASTSYIIIGDYGNHASMVPYIDSSDNDFRRRIFMSYIYPSEIYRSYDPVTLTGRVWKNENNEIVSSFNISNTESIKSPSYNDFSDGETVILLNNMSVVGSYLYNNWYSPSFWDIDSGQFTSNANLLNALKETTTSNYASAHRSITNTGKRGITVLSDIVPQKIPQGAQSQSELAELLAIDVVNIKKPAIPYGGQTQTSINNSVYYSFGDYNVFTGSTDEMFVYDGDVYIGMFIYNSSHAWRSSTYRSTMETVVYSVPLESRIDLLATYGDLYTRIEDNSYSYYVQDEPCEMGPYMQQKPTYAYNTAYSSNMTAYMYSPINRNRVTIDNFDTRIAYSNLKTNGEYIDSWLSFKSANYIDVDTRYGEITNLRLFKDYLMFWQDNATGVLSVNERTVLQDQNDTNIILGNGDVLQRYDYLTTVYGMKPNQGADGQSNTTLYWWDGNKKDILAYSGGQEILPMKKTKGVSNYINQHDEVDKPSLAYDVKYDEILMSVAGYDPLVYNELTQLFTSVYTTGFDNKMQFADQLLLLKRKRVFKWNTVENLDGEPNSPHAYLKYIVNTNHIYTKVYDNVEFNGKFSDKDELSFGFSTPLLDNVTYLPIGHITDREYNYRFAVPRYNNSSYGDRLRGKTMLCEIEFPSEDGTQINSTDFSLQYIITKFRISWS